MTTRNGVAGPGWKAIQQRIFELTGVLEKPNRIKYLIQHEGVPTFVVQGRRYAKDQAILRTYSLLDSERAE